MGSNFHGEGVYTCHHECRQDGCPTHRIRLFSKHGGYYVLYGNDRRVDMPGDVALIDAIANILNNESHGTAPATNAVDPHAQLPGTLTPRDESPASLGDCVACDGYILDASEFPHCPSCARLTREGKPL